MNRKQIIDSLPTFGQKTKEPFVKPEKVQENEKKRYPLRKIGLKRQERMKGVTESDIFNEIWSERPHVSELSGKPLPYPKGHKMWVNQFLHVINKGRSNKYRLEKRNIMLGLPSEHDRQNTFPKFVERLQELTRELYKK